MALGSYDANGIWHYGESDNIALFSDTLNKLADSASSAITSDRARLASLENGSLAGSIPVVPVSVAVASGSVAVNSLGVVTFTAASAVSLNSVFTSKYRNYLVVYKGTAGTASAEVEYRFRTAGVDNTSSLYVGTGWLMPSNAANVALGFTANYQFFGNTRNAADAHLGGTINIQGPQEAMWTTTQSLSTGHHTTVVQSVLVAGCFAANTQFDGITFFPQSGLISGSVQIFGIND